VTVKNLTVAVKRNGFAGEMQRSRAFEPPRVATKFWIY